MNILVSHFNLFSTYLWISPFDPSILVVEQNPDTAGIGRLVSAREKNLLRACLSISSPTTEEIGSFRQSTLILWSMFESAHPGSTEEPVLEENSHFIEAGHRKMQLQNLHYTDTCFVHKFE